MILSASAPRWCFLFCDTSPLAHRPPRPPPPRSLVTLLDLLRDMFSVYVERSPTEHLDSYMPIVKAAEMRSSESPPVMVAYLGMLGGLASAAPGAKWVQEWMVTSNSDITWDRMFSYLHTYCDMLQQDPSSAGAAPLALHLPRPESAMPQEDAVGLAAFADVLAKVVNNMEDAALEPMREVLSRLSRVNRAWDVALFDLMCYRWVRGAHFHLRLHRKRLFLIASSTCDLTGRDRLPSPSPSHSPRFCNPDTMAIASPHASRSPRSIPSVLKAALMRSLAAVVAHPASDPLANPHGILQSLHEAEILRNDLRPGAVHYDIRYQLEEVEARTERYPETLAFVKLLNALFSRCPVGPECARYTLFVTEVSGPCPCGGGLSCSRVSRRRIAVVSQCWSAVAVADDAAVPTIRLSHRSPRSVLLLPTPV